MTLRGRVLAYYSITSTEKKILRELSTPVLSFTHYIQHKQSPHCADTNSLTARHTPHSFTPTPKVKGQLALSACALISS